MAEHRELQERMARLNAALDAAQPLGNHSPTMFMSRARYDDLKAVADFMADSVIMTDSGKLVATLKVGG